MAMSRSFGETSFTSRSPMRISPEVASSSPATIRSAVVLPQPDGPTRTRNSLSRISRLTLLTAMTFLNVLVRFRRVTPAIDTLLHTFRRRYYTAGDQTVSIWRADRKGVPPLRLCVKLVEELHHLLERVEGERLPPQRRLRHELGRLVRRAAEQGQAHDEHVADNDRAREAQQHACHAVERVQGPTGR